MYARSYMMQQNKKIYKAQYKALHITTLSLL
jgi:hypothetical protein